MTRFDPTNVETIGIIYRNEAYRVSKSCWDGGTVVSREDYDSLLALYNAERQARKDDAKEFQREARDIAAEARWAERESRENY